MPDQPAHSAAPASNRPGPCLDLSLFSSAQGLIIMLSGGSDSVALLQLMAAQRQDLGPLRALHVNHCLRGPAAEADQRFSQELCARLGIEFVAQRADIPAILQQRGGNLEAVAREERYRLAWSEAQKLAVDKNLDHGAVCLVLAHTASDRAEGFFMRSIVGGSAASLAGMRAEGGGLIRPLLKYTREDLREYLQAEAVEIDGRLWCEDESNADEDYFRAFVRHGVIGRAKAFNPRLEHNLARALDVLGEESDFLEALAQEAMAGAARIAPDGSLLLEAPALMAQPLAIRRRCAASAIRRMLPSGERLEGLHVDALLRALAAAAGDGAGSGSVTDLLCGLHMEREGSTLALLPAAASAEYAAGAALLERGVELPVPGVLEVPGICRIEARWAEPGECYEGAAASCAYVHAGAGEAGLRLWLRSPRVGERMQPLGMGGKSRKLSDLLSEAKLPRRQRRAYPLIVDGPGQDAACVWLPGIRLDERFKCTPRTERNVFLYCAFSESRPWDEAK